ncbi:MAG TPA: allophanate hydrolase [Mycobacteriales bacterium]|nr:allophanate hydrolase [Mycobacteriales bacterium]
MIEADSRIAPLPGGAPTPGGRPDPHAVVDAVLQRRTAVGDPDHVWISVLPEEDLRRRADELAATHRDRRGELAGLPLYAIPFAVKDNIDVAGLPTTAGCPAWARYPATTATAVRRLLAAGAILVGKTNLDQFATGLTGARSPYGACESVFGGRLISGGSSSGSAVAVAAGMVSFALGTDTAGSGRVPAALNGIVGVKPTRGSVSTSGVVPACRSLDCVSVFARTVAEAVDVLDVLHGYDHADPWSRRAPACPPDARPGPTPWLGIPASGTLDFYGDEAMRRAYAVGQDRVVRACGGAIEVDIGPLLEAGDLLYGGPWVAERLADLGDFLRAHPDDVLPVTREVLRGGQRFTGVDVFRAEHRLRELRRWTERLWETVDVLVLPTIGTTYTIEQVEEEPIERNSRLGRYTQFANLLDLAAVTIPAGRTDDGRPASLTLFGPAWSEPLLTGLAALLAAAP